MTTTIGCTVNGCEKRHSAHGFCAAHYSRWLRHGDPNGGRITPGLALSYYVAHRDDVTEDCVLWPYSTTGNGYGKIWIDGRSELVHILTARRHLGPRPLGMWVAHQPLKCHKPSCFAWRHLRYATPAENQSDRVLDDTHHIGERHHRAKLTDIAVREIRAAYEEGETTYQELGNKYGVTMQAIRAVVIRHTWRHVTPVSGADE